MSEIDLRPGPNDYRVSTSVRRDGVDYMGPDVLVKARDEDHAVEIVKQNGLTPNHHFPPKRISSSHGE